MSDQSASLGDFSVIDLVFFNIPTLCFLWRSSRMQVWHCTGSRTYVSSTSGRASLLFHHQFCSELSRASLRAAVTSDPWCCSEAANNCTFLFMNNNCLCISMFSPSWNEMLILESEGFSETFIEMDLVSESFPPAFPVDDVSRLIRRSSWNHQLWGSQPRNKLLNTSSRPNRREALPPRIYYSCVIVWEDQQKFFTC